MQILQTRNQIKILKSPSRLEVLRELQKRGALKGEMKDDLYKLELGNEGEQTVMKWLHDFGLEHWRVLQNLWLNKNGHFECDILLLTHAKIYHFEIKNYTKKFAYQYGQCYFNGEKMSHNAISQAQRVFINFENILKEEQFQVPVESVLVFAGEHCDIAIHDAIQDVMVKPLHRLRDYIYQIIAEEQAFKRKPFDLNHFLQIIEKVEVLEPPFAAEPITDEIKARIRPGIICSRCGSFDVDSSKADLVCTCKMHEPRENAIVRTICEYGVIHFEKELVTTEVLEFLGNEISRSNLYFYLEKHFQKKGSNRSTRFTNLSIPIKRCHREFKFEKDRRLRIEDY